MHPLQRLVDAGLIFETCAPDEPFMKGRFSWLYWVAKPATNPHSTHLFGDQKTPIEDAVLNLGYLVPNSLALGHHPFWDWPLQTDAWTLWLWDYLPGPGATDFVSSCEALQQVINHILDFYFGTPTVIDSWAVPLHRHPELILPTVQDAIRGAVPMAASAFQLLSNEYHEREPRSSWHNQSWAKVFQTRFLTIPHQYDPTMTLYLRRDLQEAFTVSTQAG